MLRETLEDFYISKKRYFFYVTCLLPALITIIVYLPSLNNGFVNWDDDMYVYENINIRVIDFAFFKWLLSSVVVSNWHPLTVFSYAFDYSIWGNNPFGYHLTNILIHSANTFLVALISVMLISFYYKRNYNFYSSSVLAASFISAIFFGIHPIHVESVAWISERKDVLFLFFYLLSTFCYLKYVHIKRYWSSCFYCLSILFFIFSLMSKPMAVSLPIVFIIIDIFPLKRIDKNNIKSILKEKILFLLLAFLVVLVTFKTQNKVIEKMDIPFIERVAVSMHSYLFYIVKMIIPLNFSPYYPYPKNINILSFEYLSAIFIFLLITVYAICSFKRRKIFGIAWIYYLLTLLPVIGIVQVGAQKAADRYTYLPSLAISLIFGVSILCLLNKKFVKGKKIIFFTLIMFVMISSFSFLTIKQISVWKDSNTLWLSSIKYEDSATARYNLGMFYVDSGNLRAAEGEFNKAVLLDFDYFRAHNNLGNISMMKKDYISAIKAYEETLRSNPLNFISNYNIGICYENIGNYKKAREFYLRFIENAGPEFNYQINDIKQKIQSIQFK